MSNKTKTPHTFKKQKGVSRYVTFICDNPKCGKEKSRVKQTVNKYSNNYCSMDCYNEARKSIFSDKKRTTCSKCYKNMKPSDVDVGLSYRFSTFCKSCRTKKRERIVSDKRLRRKAFIKRWNEFVLQDEVKRRLSVG